MENRSAKPLPGQFRLRGLFVLTTLAAVAFWIMRWPLSLHLKLFFICMLWFLFQMWQLTRLKPTASPAERLNVAVTGIVGQVLLLAVFVTPIVTASHSLGAVGYLALAAFAIGLTLGIWQAIRTIRQAVAESKNVGPAAPHP